MVASPMTTGHFSKLLWPGINRVFWENYKKHPKEYLDLFDKQKSDKAFEEDQQIVGMGLFPEMSETNGVQYDAMQQGYTWRYIHTTYGMGFIISRELYEDNQYDRAMLSRATALAFSASSTKNTLAANVYNRAFNSSYTFGDNKELCATDHSNYSGGTFSNELNPAADLSELSLEQATIDIAGFETDRGLTVAIMPEKLIIPRQLLHEANRILNSDGRVGTDYNDLNSLKSMNMFPGGFKVNHYLTDADAWFIRTNAPLGMTMFERRPDTFSEDNDFDTDNAKYKCTFRVSFGTSDPRSIYGSAGA